MKDRTVFWTICVLDFDIIENKVKDKQKRIDKILFFVHKNETVDVKKRIEEEK